jgi:hypothetical protein
MTLFAPPSSNGSPFALSTSAILIVLALAAIGIVAIIGWRSPDRSPGADDKAERDRIDD